MFINTTLPRAACSPSAQPVTPSPWQKDNCNRNPRKPQRNFSWRIIKATFSSRSSFLFSSANFAQYSLSMVWNRSYRRRQSVGRTRDVLTFTLLWNAMWATALYVHAVIGRELIFRIACALMLHSSTRARALRGVRVRGIDCVCIQSGAYFVNLMAIDVNYVFIYLKNSFEGADMFQQNIHPLRRHQNRCESTLEKKIKLHVPCVISL